MAAFTPTLEQEKIFQFKNGLATIFAGPGTGKTSTLLRYVEQQTSQKPQRILLLCFNRNVRNELQSRLKQTVASNVQVETFHSLARRILSNSFAESLKKSNTTGLKSKVMRQALKEANNNNAELNDFERFIDHIKAEVIPEAPQEDPLTEAYKVYESIRKNESLIFFEDWLQLYAQLLRRNGSPHYDLVLADEAQDLNPIQYELFRLLCQHAHTAMMVGDVDQTLYEWRKARPQQLIDVQLDHLKRHNFTLSQTFRFGHHQAMVSQALIQENNNRYPMITVSKLSTATPLLIHATDAIANVTIRKITEWQRKNPQAHIAVVSRLWSHLEPLQLGLSLRAMPYFIKEDHKLTMKRGFALVQALAALHDPSWDHFTKATRVDHLLALMTQPKQAIKNDALHTHARSLAAVARCDLYSAVEHITSHNYGAEASALSHITSALQLLQSAGESGAKVLGSYYQATHLLQSIQTNEILSAESGEELVHHYQTLLNVCQRIDKPLLSLASTLKAHLQPKPGNTKLPLLTLGSTHFHKGMEYDYVVVISQENWGKDPFLTDADRCNLYVALTRAKKETAVILPVCNTIEQILPVAEASELLTQYAQEKTLASVMLPKLRTYAIKANWLHNSSGCTKDSLPQIVKSTDAALDKPSITIKQRLRHRASGKWHQVISLQHDQVILFNPYSRIRQHCDLTEVLEHYEAPNTNL